MARCNHSPRKLFRKTSCKRDSHQRAKTRPVVLLRRPAIGRRKLGSAAALPGVVVGAVPSAAATSTPAGRQVLQGIVVRAPGVEHQYGAPRRGAALGGVREEVGDPPDAAPIIILFVDDDVHEKDLGAGRHLDGPAPEVAPRQPQGVVVDAHVGVPVDPIPQGRARDFELRVLGDELRHALPHGVPVLAVVADGLQPEGDGVEEARAVAWHPESPVALLRQRLRRLALPRRSRGGAARASGRGAAREVGQGVCVLLPALLKVRTSLSLVRPIALVAGHIAPAAHASPPSLGARGAGGRGRHEGGGDPGRGGGLELVPAVARSERVRSQASETTILGLLLVLCLRLVCARRPGGAPTRRPARPWEVLAGKRPHGAGRRRWVAIGQPRGQGGPCRIPALHCVLPRPMVVRGRGAPHHAASADRPSPPPDGVRARVSARLSARVLR
mmetsp:Transcript_75765/g.216963  ORF Transcript_75765/g.216963 Transcript_75765/m.216963 type:complete len:443 (-) Transcript_75765:35-1363(-)